MNSVSEDQTERPCGACGDGNRSGARYCRHCGAALVEPTPEHVAAKSAPGQGGRSGLPLTRTLVIVAICLAAVIAIGAGLFLARPKPPSSDTSLQTLYVTRLVRARDKPTAVDSVVLGDLRRGERVTGHWVMGADGVTPWLRTRWTDNSTAFIWGRNLANSAPPPILSQTGPQRLQLGAPITISATPAADAPVGQTLPSGTIIEWVGAVGDNWQEIALPGGGVGYTRSSLAGAGVVP